MKKILLALLLLVLTTVNAYTIPPMPGGSVTGATINDSAGNGDNTVTWSADKVYDQLTLKLGVSDKAADADKLDNHDSTYFQVDLGLVKGTMTDGKYCTYTASGTVLNCNSDGGTGAMATDTLWDAAGDLAYGTGSNTGGRLAIGTAYQVLHTNSGATAPAWTSTLGATATRLTMGYFTNLEITNSPTVNGTALSALYQPLDSTLTGLAGIAITVDGNNVTFPGGIITTAADTNRVALMLSNTTYSPTAGTNGWTIIANKFYLIENGALVTPQTVKTEKLAVFSIPGDTADDEVINSFQPTAGTITGWNIETSGASCSAVIDIQYGVRTTRTFATIAGSEIPTLSSAAEAFDDALTTWTTAVAANSYIRAKVTSLTDCTKPVIVTINGTR